MKKFVFILSILAVLVLGSCKNGFPPPLNSLGTPADSLITADMQLTDSARWVKLSPQKADSLLHGIILGNPNQPRSVWLYGIKRLPGGRLLCGYVVESGPFEMVRHEMYFATYDGNGRLTDGLQCCRLDSMQLYLPFLLQRNSKQEKLFDNKGNTWQASEWRFTDDKNFSITEFSSAFGAMGDSITMSRIGRTTYHFRINADGTFTLTDHKYKPTGTNFGFFFELHVAEEYDLMSRLPVSADVLGRMERLQQEFYRRTYPYIDTLYTSRGITWYETSKYWDNLRMQTIASQFTTEMYFRDPERFLRWLYAHPQSGLALALEACINPDKGQLSLKQLARDIDAATAPDGDRLHTARMQEYLHSLISEWEYDRCCFGFKTE
jgi:hypothetical protein